MAIAGFTQVTKSEFFAVIGPQDVHPRQVDGDSLFETPYRALKGVIRGGDACGRGKEFYLPEASA